MDDLPEINVSGQKKRDKEKKGVIPWFRNMIGLGGAGGMATAPEGAGFLGGLLAGKSALLFTAGITALALGGGFLAVKYNVFGDGSLNKAFDASTIKSSAESPYVPAMLRGSKDASSLEMFKNANHDMFLADEQEEIQQTPPVKKQEYKESPPPVPNMQDQFKKLIGSSMGELTSSMGGANDKNSGFGGFANQFGQNKLGGPKTAFNKDLSSISASPKFDARRNRLLAIKGRRGITAKGRMTAGGRARGAYPQSKAIKATQKSYTGTDVDMIKSTQDKAWEGAAGAGEGTGGVGVGAGTGGAGVTTAPNLDNTPTPIGAFNEEQPADYTEDKPKDVSPWKGAVMIAMILIIVSAILSAIAAKLVREGGILETIGQIVAGIALMLAVMAMGLGTMIISSFGQTMLGTIYVIGGGVAATAAGMALAGGSYATYAMWMAAIAGIIGLLGSMAGGK